MYSNFHSVAGDLPVCFVSLRNKIWFSMSCYCIFPFCELLYVQFTITSTVLTCFITLQEIVFLIYRHYPMLSTNDVALFLVFHKEKFWDYLSIK